jgi:transcriptional regulator with XRE-family HTH domain
MGVNLAGTLPALLRARGWTQEQLADATGIRRTDVNALAKGRIEAGPARLSRIAAALEVSVLELGAPIEQADAKGTALLDRLEALEAREPAELVKIRRDLNAAIRRIQALERQAPPKDQRRPKKRP